MLFRTLSYSSLTFIAGASLTVALQAFAAVQTKTSDAFPDVKRDAYFSESVQNLVRQGIIKGYDDGRFGPNDYVTRGQVAVMIDRNNQEQLSLREQLEEIRSELKLGVCSDGMIQTGEECDDKNTYGGDGCSETCQKERSQTEFPVSYTAYSGAKWECYDGMTSRQADSCMSSSDWAQTAQKFCTNHCGASGKCGVNSFAVTDPCMDTQSSSSSSIDPVSCEIELQTYTSVLREHQSCTTDSDCKNFVYSCPFLTCGETINVAGTEKAQVAAKAYSACQQKAGGPISCAACAPMRDPTCQQGKCALK